MPDIYGNLTPQEVMQQRIDARRQNFAMALQSGSKGAQAGASLANIFGNVVGRRLETRGLRKTERERLIAMGVPPEQAKQQARATIAPEFKDVRLAKDVQQASKETAEFMDELPVVMDPDEKQARGMLMMAEKMRGLGLHSQAQSVTMQAFKIRREAEDRRLRNNKLRADTESSLVNTESARLQQEFIGKTEFQKNQMSLTEINNRLTITEGDDAPTMQERTQLLRMKGELEAKILKDTSIIGRTLEDARQDPVLARQLFKELSDQDSLLANVDEAMRGLDDLTAFEGSIYGTWTSDAISFAETWLARKPTESEDQFMQRVRNKVGQAAFVAAKVRHALTGAQMSAFEIGYLEPFLPSPDDSPAKQRQKMMIVKRYFELDRDARIALFQTGMLDGFMGGAAAAEAGKIAGVRPDTYNGVAEQKDINQQANERLGIP